MQPCRKSRILPEMNMHYGTHAKGLLFFEENSQLNELFYSAISLKSRCRQETLAGVSTDQRGLSICTKIVTLFI